MLGWLLALTVAPLTIADPPSPGFWLMGYPPGGTNNVVHTLSQDGSVAGGSGYGMPGFVNAAFRWTVQGGREDWGLEQGMPFNTTVSSSDSLGQAFAGYMQAVGVPDQRAYRRVGNGPIENLGTLPGETRSFASGMSGDGNVVVGHAEHGDWTNAFGQAFRWTPSAGMQGLGYLKPQGTYSVAEGISRDGKTIVGISQSFGPAGPKEAFVWTEATGMKGLPGLLNAPFPSTYAYAVNSNGKIVVGSAPSQSGVNHAVRWIDGRIEDLGIAPGTSDSFAFAMSDDGSVVGGSAGAAGHNWAIVWTPVTGMTMLSDFLDSYGVSIPTDYRLEDLYAISGDGLTFAGMARNLLTNKAEGFVATVPAPATVSILFAMPLIVRPWRRRR